MNAQLLRHAIANVWCNPAQDRQFVYRLARLTPRYGSHTHIRLFYEQLELPQLDVYYHIYQIGKAIPRRLGLPLKTRTWMRFSDLAESELLYSELYLDNGVQFPRFNSYIRLTENRNLIVAVPINDRIGDLEDSPLYLRVYSNAYFESDRSEGRRYIHCNGIRAKTQDDILLLQRELRLLTEDLGGYPYHFVNGRYVQDLSLTTAQVGDVLEYVLDGSIKRLVEFEVDDLPAFHSKLDTVRKYILHYDDPTVQQIEYLDDVDVFLINPTIQNRFTGVGYHRNETDWLRMLTHKDYSVPADRVKNLALSHPEDPRHLENSNRWSSTKWTTPKGKRLQVFIRHSGYERPLVPEASRIQELYRLSSQQIIEAMTGTDAVLGLWRAENLEQSAYVRTMSADPYVIHPISYNDPTVDDVAKKQQQELMGELYGYHAAATILANTPSPVENRNGALYAELAYEHWKNATVFEYDSAGVLLGWYYHPNGKHYPVRNPTCKTVEVLTGQGSKSPNTVYGSGSVTIPEGHNFRVYVTPMWRGIPQGQWVDITDMSALSDYGYLDTSTTPHVWRWLDDSDAVYGAVRIDDAFYCREIQMNRHAGHLSFSVMTVETHQGVRGETELQIPYGQFDLFLNGRSLIEGLDYRVEWPRVTLNNYEYLTPDVQKIVMRAHGFCHPDLTRLENDEFGFIQYGVLSNNHRFNVHEHKVRRIVVGGSYHRDSDLEYAEDNANVVIENASNGAPYQIQTPPVVFREVYDNDLLAREIDDEKDRAVSDYLTLKLPHPRVGTSDFIEQPYRVFSVFANKVMHDLLNGVLYPEGIKDQYGEDDIREWCQPYEWLLAIDICNTDYDDAHIEVYPHWYTEPVELDLYQYNFYVRTLEHYLRHRPDVSAFVKVV
jgi:hypothetical protein